MRRLDHRLHFPLHPLLRTLFGGVDKRPRALNAIKEPAHFPFPLNALLGLTAALA